MMWQYGYHTAGETRVSIISVMEHHICPKEMHELIEQIRTPIAIYFSVERDVYFLQI